MDADWFRGAVLVFYTHALSGELTGEEFQKHYGEKLGLECEC
jgi:hypothetical protein